MTVVHSYFYIVVDTQRGCRTLKLKLEIFVMSSYFKSRVFVCHDTASRDKVKSKIAFYVICIPRISPI